MSQFVVHSVPGSPYGRAVFLLLEEKGVSWRLAPLAPGTAQQPAHLARHPFGKIPALEHQGFGLYETQAILRYIDRVVQQPAFTPSEPRAAAVMDLLMNVNDNYLFQGVSTVIGFQRIVGPRLFGLTPDEEAIAAAMPRAHTVFAELSLRLGDKPYFAGEAPSLADLMIAPQLDFISQTPEWAPLTQARDNLQHWMDRMAARPSFAATSWERLAQLAASASGS